MCRQAYTVMRKPKLRPLGDDTLIIRIPHFLPEPVGAIRADVAATHSATALVGEPLPPPPHPRPSPLLFSFDESGRATLHQIKTQTDH